MKDETTDPLDAPAPRARNHELAVLGCCFFEELRPAILTQLRDIDLIDRDCRLAMKAVRALHADGAFVSYSTIRLHLDGLGLKLADTFWRAFAIDDPEPWRYEDYVRQLRDATLCRMLHDGARRIANLAVAGNVDSLVEARELVRAVDESAEGATTLPSLRETFAEVERELDRPVGSAVGIGTGLPALDRVTNGLRGGQFIVVAGRPGMGKSILGLLFARSASLRQSKTTAYVSLEMSRSELARRLLAAETDIPHDRIRGALLNPTERAEIGHFARQYGGYDLFIDDSGRLSIEEVERRARGLQQLYGVDLLIVDYLQLLDVPPGRNREQEVARLSRNCKAMARSLGIPVVVLSQLSRQCETREDKRPMLHDLRESGSLEQDSDLVLMLYREAYYDKTATDQADTEIIVAKQRDGDTGVVHCRFDGAKMRFTPSVA